MWDDFAEYIINEVGDEKVTIAEIAVGKFDRIAEMLSAKENTSRPVPPRKRSRSLNRPSAR